MLKPAVRVVTTGLWTVNWASRGRKDGWQNYEQ